MLAIVISTALQNLLADAAADEWDGGVLEIRTGAAPGPNAADDGTLLASIDLPTPAYGDAASGSAAIAGTWEDASADATGTAAHFRFKKSGDTGGATGSADERIEGTVTGTGGGGDLELDNTSITSGQSIEISSFPITQPSGA